MTMPGEATQRIVLCTPYATAGEHDAHPLKLDGETAWCPGNPPRHPDGTPVTGDDVRAAATEEENRRVVALAGELRDVREQIAAAEAGEGTEARGRLADALKAAADAGDTPLTAMEYEFRHKGVPIRITRRDEFGSLPRMGSDATPGFAVTVARSQGVEVHAFDVNRGSLVGVVGTGAAVGFGPGSKSGFDKPELALEVAEAYAREVADAIDTYRQTLDQALLTFQHMIVAAREHFGVTPVIEDRKPE